MPLLTVVFEGFINSKEQRTEHRVQQHSIYSTVGKPIAMMFTEAITSMFTKTSVFTYNNITIKQSANKGVNYNKFLYTVNSNLQDSINSVCILCHISLLSSIVYQSVRRSNVSTSLGSSHDSVSFRFSTCGRSSY